ncbi:MAG: hypothetical protein U9Q96_00160 [Patescibacteria group bacterium]|nr:hypothetical protein [Patescibacteria group bacterium]
MDFLKKIQKLPLAQRKIIFWIVMIVIGLIFLFFFLFITTKRLNNFPGSDFKQDINFPSFEKEDFSFPSLDDDWEEQINQ